MATERRRHASAPDEEAEPRRVEPWPWLVVGLLVAMIGSSLGFYWVAATNPDPPVVEDAYRAGLEYAEQMRVPATPEAPPGGGDAPE